MEGVKRAIQTYGPGRGDAVITATLDANGNVGDVELVSGTDGEWANVIRALRRQMLVHVRVPPGARGLRVTLKVSVKIQRVSGIDARRSAIGLTFDVSDLSGVIERLANVRILSEEILR